LGVRSFKDDSYNEIIVTAVGFRKRWEIRISSKPDKYINGGDTALKK